MNQPRDEAKPGGETAGVPAPDRTIAQGPPGEPLLSGFNFRPVREVPQASLSAAAQARVLRKMAAVDDARRRAAGAASTAIVG